MKVIRGFHRFARVAGLVCAAGAAAAATGVAQDAPRSKGSVIIGIVADTNKAPLQGVEVIAVKSGRTATTNKDGIFVLRDLPQGEEQIRIRRIGYAAQTFEASIVGGDTLRVGVVLAVSAQILPELGVTAKERKYTGLLAGFEERRLTSGAPPSSFVPRDSIEAWKPLRLIDVLSRSGMKTRLAGTKRIPVCPRGYTALPQTPAVYLNGARVMGTFDLENLDPMNQVEAIEIYRSPAEVPSIFNRNDAPCVIVIWTRVGGSER